MSVRDSQDVSRESSLSEDTACPSGQLIDTLIDSCPVLLLAHTCEKEDWKRV